MSVTAFSATVVRRCPLGRIEAAHDLNGPLGMQVDAFRHVLEQTREGDTLELEVTRNLPADHPLIGIDLAAPTADLAPELSGVEAPAPAIFWALAAYAARVLQGTDGMWPPAARATECRRALEHIEAECRRMHAATITDEGAQR